ncbi:MAG TPA: AI-2E family transporter, partial [Terriglobales bacterium]|nr:AI-2E family transporter [Terriglobales bacterium]
GKHRGLEQAQSTAKEVLGELQKDQVAKGETKPVPVVVKSDSGGIWQIPRILEALGGAGFVVVLVMFMLIEQHEIRNRFIRLTGHGRLASVTRALDEAAERISHYLVAQTMINAGYGLALGTGLSFIGVPYAVMWGFLAFALRFIPYLGPLMAAVAPMALSLAVFSDWQRPLLTAALFLVVELLTYTVIEPLLYGHTTGVSQVALFVALAFWTWLWGPVGLALGTPLTVCLVVLGKHVAALGFLDVMMTDEQGLPADISYYQRLLANDCAEGAEILDGYLAEHSREQVYDDIVLPALSRAKRDRQAQRLSEKEVQAIFQVASETLAKLAARRPADERGDAVPVGFGDSAPRVLACAAGDEGDEIALTMLRQLLNPTDCAIETAGSNALSGEILLLAADMKPVVAVIAALRPAGLARTRHLCKRLRSRFPDLKILVGRWGGGDEDPAEREMLRAAGADEVATMLLQSRDQLIERVRLT